MTGYPISNDIVWIMLPGGFREYNRSTHTHVVSDSDDTIVVELGMIINNHVMYYYY